MAWIFLLGVCLGGIGGWWLRVFTTRKEPPAPPPMTEEEQRKLREFQRFLSYDGYPDD